MSLFPQKSEDSAPKAPERPAMHTPQQPAPEPVQPQAAPSARPQPQPRPAAPRIEMPRPRILTPEQHLERIKAQLAEADKIPDLIPCEHLGKINDVPFSDVYITPDKKCPNLKSLGLPVGLYKYLLSLSGRSGLILLAGPTGSGKSTTISALLQEYLTQKGGYCFTIEDPIELPLDGVYLTPSGELGLCKQTTPPDGIWQEGIKSALRSKPRYIYLGEIRDPNVASEALRAATSGHLVLSTIHANNVSDSINSLVKYAASSGISEEMAFELVANGFLGCLHQILSGAPKQISVTYVFANPDLSAGCQVRSMFRNGKLNLSTVMEQQKIKMDKGMPLF